MKKILSFITLSLVVAVFAMPLMASATVGRYAPCSAVQGALDTLNTAKDTLAATDSTENRDAVKDAAAAVLTEVITCNTLRLDRLEAKVTDSDAEYKDEILAEITALRSSLADLQGQIDAGIADKDAFHVLKDEIKAVLKEGHIKLKKYLHKRTIARLNTVIARGEDMSIGFDEDLVSFQEAELSTAALEDYLASFQAKLSETISYRDSLSAKLTELESAATDDEAKVILTEVKDLIQDAFSSYREGRVLVRGSIIPEIRSLRAEL